MKHILLGITGSISAYKSLDLIRELIRNGYQVTPLATERALDFITPLSLSVLAETPVLTDSITLSGKITHLAKQTTYDALVIAPASANSIAKFSAGLADDLLSSTMLAFSGPKLIIPAMHTSMWTNPVTQNNIKRLCRYGIQFLAPVEGDLACGDKGMGRLPSVPSIIQKINSLFLPPLPLHGKKILITSGGTYEPIDPVRVISNKSTGKMGRSLAELAAFSGADVTLLTREAIDLNANIRQKIFTSASSLESQVREELKDHDALYMAAAVSDFKPESRNEKLSRSKTKTLHLSQTSDILEGLSSLKKKNTKIIGFCLATEHKLEEIALKKLQKKSLDYIIANTPDSFGKDERSFLIISKEGAIQSFSKVPLQQTAHHLLSLIV